MESVWAEKTTLPRREPLRGNIKTDVLIIGGGLAGLLCAWKLQKKGVSYVLTEANSLCGGITKNTTAKITSQHGLIYAKLIRIFGEERARMYLAANEDALAQYRALCENIDCDFEEKDAYVYSLDDRAKLERELTALEDIGYGAGFADKLCLPFPVAGAVRFPRQAQFDPLKFAAALSSELQIYENTSVQELAEGRAVTERGVITAEKIIVATHFPILNKHGGYFLKQYQHRSYVIALKNAANVDGMYVDEAQKGLSFRNSGELLLVGGGGHRTGKNGGGWQELADFADRYYPKAEETNRWAAQDCMTLDGVPYIGRYGRHTQGLYVATGFNKWGMTSAMVSATILAAMMTGEEPSYAPVFSPARTMLRPQLALNAAQAAVNLLSPGAKRCPHLGCALRWNEQEHSWDCPCHGSRFSAVGELLDNPATGGLKKKA